GGDPPPLRAGQLPAVRRGHRARQDQDQSEMKPPGNRHISSWDEGRKYVIGEYPRKSESANKKGGDRSPPFMGRRPGRAYARRRLITSSAPLASRRARRARPSSESVGTWMIDATANEVGSLTAAVPGSSVRIDDSLVPLPSASK